MTYDMLRRMYEYNRRPGHPSIEEIESIAKPNREDTRQLYQHMITTHTLRIATIISGQGPEAFGMPEMCVPSFRINYNRALRQLVSLITDGRYSGTNFGVSVGHVTPEAIHGGGIAYLQTGDLMHLQFRAGRLDLIDRQMFADEGKVVPHSGSLAEQRAGLGLERRAHLDRRARRITPSNRMLHHTDAAHGVVPAQVAEWATDHWQAPVDSVPVEVASSGA
jgi:hypothetical protein